MPETLSGPKHSQARVALWVCGLVLLVAGAGAIVSDALACTNCNCYYSEDCASGQTCSYSSGCRVWKAGGTKTVDGTCVASAVLTGPDTTNGALALDYWMRAYEQAGQRGGDPDSTLVAEALAVPLSPQQQGAIRRAVMDTQVVLFGMADDPRGYFEMPDTAVLTTDLCPVDVGSVPITQTTAPSISNGTLKKLSPEQLGVAAIVREAMVAELANPYHSNFDAIMDRIPREFPNFVSSGICRYPREDDPNFPYQGSLGCLKYSSLSTVRAMLVGPHVTPMSRTSRPGSAR